MNNQFDPDEALSRYGALKTSVILWRPGWGSDRNRFETMREALFFAKSDISNPLKIELHVHAHGHDILFEGEKLQALMSRGGDVSGG